MEQLAKPSTTWDRLNASACKQALQYTKFLDAAYLAQLADEGQPIRDAKAFPPGPS